MLKTKPQVQRFSEKKTTKNNRFKQPFESDAYFFETDAFDEAYNYFWELQAPNMSTTLKYPKS